MPVKVNGVVVMRARFLYPLQRYLLRFNDTFLLLKNLKALNRQELKKVVEE